MCKFCEKENVQYVLKDDIIYLYIMNNKHIPPQIVFGDYNGVDSFHRNININYYPICGERLVN